MKVIVGLGNPGPEYVGTRHNVGFEVIGELARRWQARFRSWQGVADYAILRDRDVLLAEPQTFMNASGEAVGELLRYFKAGHEGLLVVVDEVQLPLGRLRARVQGSAGGHNGLRSVIAHVGEDFARLRLGVGRGDDRRSLADHVLARFDRDEQADAGHMIERAADAAEVFVTDGIAAVMNRFNTGDPATTE